MRGGLATQSELEECLLKLSGFHPHLQGMLHLLSTLYFDEKFPFAPFLEQVDEELYADAIPTAAAYQSVIETAHSYFYKETLYYPLESLVGLIARELASKWQGYADSFIERALRICNSFRVRKAESEKLIVRLG